MNIREKIKELISEVATREVDVSSITDQTILTSDLGFDSIQIISLIVELESCFGIEIENDDLDIEKLTVYSNLCEMIEGKINS